MSSKSEVPPGLSNFIRLNPAVWFLEPSSPTVPSDPDLILLVGWMDATSRHISKYTAGYTALYPTSRILTITTTGYDFVFRTQASNEARIAPALEILYGLPKETKLLLHFFSNGGATTTAFVAKAYKEKTGRVLPVKGVVLDSNPGKAIYGATVKAFSVALPKNIVVRCIGVFVWSVLLFLYLAQYRVRGRLDIIERARREVNDKGLMEIKAPRVYVYSETDPMVDWRFVEEHGEDAKKLGYKIEREKFVGSGHCGHMLLDRERYWKIIQRLWGMVDLD